MRLSQRERYIVMLATIFVMVFVILEVLIFPFIDYKNKIIKGVAKKEKDIIDIVDLAAVYKKMKSDIDVVQQVASKRDKNFSLFTFLETASRTAQIKDNIKYMKPSESKPSGGVKESMVEMEIDNISFDRLVEFLYAVEYSDYGIALKRMSIKAKQNQKGIIDAILQIVTYEQVS